ncbi:hypothetical protein JV173_02330 [Acholeplasma equirhinis]|uniref:alpha-amylase family glycosyl hydrolase n=1 Tax=Acholeplasma equirhinis TaxID=555393 RepID=UPI00197A9830|nr:alpha-amylase family glycosyl hydrolase [Acholeplasma equirhinis]MBN3490344.1 hypothetical protein [Acholeplasma equirhinis]
MAKQTPKTFRNLSIYQVFVRQHTPTGDFKGLMKDLDRIKSLGMDVIYLLPIHPIGEKDRKGSKGSPYSIVDYYAIDKDYGTLEDFKQLINEAHNRGMKIMIDIVFNHTSRDSVLTKSNPDWFYRKPDGTLANRVGDWSDIADLDFRVPGVSEYLIDVLKYWAQYVDGFRCDVAPLLPLEFWMEARKQLDPIRPDLIWLSESVEYGFIKYLRDIGFDASTDSQIFEAFDIAYDYDIFSFMDGYLHGRNSLERYLYEVWRQETVYPKNYVKLRSFENHDQERLASKTKDSHQFIQMTSMQFFLKGSTMIYAGQEHQIKKRPDLFELDPLPWNDLESIEPLIQKLTTLKKDPLFTDGIFEILDSKDIAIISYRKGHRKLIGIFNLEGKNVAKVDLPNGIYQNLLSDNTYQVKNSMLLLDQEPIIFEVFE